MEKEYLFIHNKKYVGGNNVFSKKTHHLVIFIAKVSIQNKTPQKMKKILA